MTDLLCSAFQCHNCCEWLLPPACCCDGMHIRKVACPNCKETFVIKFCHDERAERLLDLRLSEGAITLARARP